MAAHHVVFVAGAAWQLLCESPMVLGAPLLHLNCCVDELDINGSCPFNATCRPDCYQLRFENGTTTCVRCKPESPSNLLYNISCVYSNETYFPSNASTTAPPQPKIASILQPSEMAAMIPTPTSSVRKPRYVRRERPSVMSTAATITSDATTRVSNV
ncbi:uncharacterized protein C1orf159 homolog isoform X2 [Polypterus senegalus]|uniref:uncharacterized protein C1orf159 homolog isoform X2 n=1 Tax=Polypterus senegalus TaxID=55291 RepID=UPI001962F1AB|nr:uncharacterized protein C1orf159 homolog isoform X2 [Polypterus senegalus]